VVVPSDHLFDRNGDPEIHRPTDAEDVPEMKPATATSLTTDENVMTLLHDHVPLALLCDLTVPDGPPSTEILAEEGEPVTRWWES
jgi:hypothetical protein